MHGVDQTFCMIQEKLKKRIGEASFESWFDGLSFDNFVSGQLTLSLPTRFSADYVRRNYLNVLLDTFSEHFEDIKNISIENHHISKTTSSLPHTISDTPILQTANENTHTEPTWFVQSLLNNTYTFENFCVAPSNQFAMAAARKICETDQKLFNLLFLYAPVGLGKTHLLHAIANKIQEATPNRRVMYTSIQKFSEMFVRSIKSKDAYRFKDQFNAVDVLLIDDFQFIDGKKSFQEEFLHILNEFMSTGRQVVVSANRPLNVLGLSPALKSRLVSGVLSDIGHPEKELRVSVLKTHCALLGQTISTGLMDFLAEVLSQNLRELIGGLRRIMTHMTLSDKMISITEAKSILSDLMGGKTQTISFEHILDKVSSYLGVSTPEILGHSRLKRIVYARRIVMFLCSKLTPLSSSEIARKVGDKNHSTVLYAVRDFEKMRQTTPMLFDDIEALETILKTS